MDQKLKGKVAVVAGATRGAGRGIARMLGERGATVYCSGRSTRGKSIVKGASVFASAGRAETIDETAELVNALGGVGIAVKTDHSQEAEVRALFERVQRDHGRLDVLVNDIWGAEELTQFDKAFWEQDVTRGLQMVERAVFTHVITSRHGVPLMLKQPGGLVVEITDGDRFFRRHDIFYDLCKIAVIRLAFSMSEELRPHGVAAVAVTPGFLRSEAMLEHFGVTEKNWRDAKDPHFAQSETPALVGRGVAALAADPDVMRWSGRLLASWTLAREYRFSDEDGRAPDWGAYLDACKDDPELAEIRDVQRRSHDAYVRMGV